MKSFKLCAIVALMLSFHFMDAQQLPQFTQYMFNTISINPAYAGSRETFSAVGLHRSQWVGLEGGPQTQTISAHSPLRNDKIGLGGSFINDRLGFENFTYFYADFSYTIQSGENSELAFGLKAGFTNYFLDRELLNDPDVASDPFFADFSNRWDPNVGVGLLWHSQKWYVGLSAPRIINQDYNESRAGAIDYAALERVSYYLTAGYVFDLNDNTKFRPSALLKTTNGAPLSFDLTGMFLFNDKFWIGGAYRANQWAQSLGALADFQVTRELRLGYAYEYPLSDLSPFTSGTHEVLLIYEVFKNKRIKSPRYF